MSVKPSSNDLQNSFFSGNYRERKQLEYGDFQQKITVPWRYAFKILVNSMIRADTLNSAVQMPFWKILYVPILFLNQSNFNLNVLCVHCQIARNCLEKRRREKATTLNRVRVYVCTCSATDTTKNVRKKLSQLSHPRIADIENPVFFGGLAIAAIFVDCSYSADAMVG